MSAHPGGDTSLGPQQDMRRIRVSGRAMPLIGNDIDTDQIMPARFLKEVTFERLGEHAFGDVRIACRRAGEVHPFDDPRFALSRVLLVNKNFGCGSSREHAAEALRRRGFAAIIGESFGEIFMANCTAIGIVAVRVDRKTIEALQETSSEDPGRVLTIDLEARTVVAGNHVYPVEISEGPRRQLVDGEWDAVRLLLRAGAAIEKTAASLPYMNGWR